MEHLEEKDLPQLFDNVRKHLISGGIFIGSIATFDDTENGVHWHRTINSKDWWKKKFEELGLPFTENYDFEFGDFCRGNGNGKYDWNEADNHELGFHFVARKL